MSCSCDEGCRVGERPVPIASCSSSFAALGAIVGALVGPPLLGGSVGLVVGGTLGAARRPAWDGEMLRVLGICVVVFGTLSAALLDHVSHLHVCLQPWRVILFDWVHFNGKTYPCLTWWTRGRSVLVSLDAMFLGGLLLIQGQRAHADEAAEVPR